MNNQYIKSDSYKGHFFETRFSFLISYNDDGTLNYQINTEYFIDYKKIKFKNINIAINRFNISEDIRSDIVKLHHIDIIKELPDKEIDYLKEMFDLDLVEEIKI
jgi:hypothetical protein